MVRTHKKACCYSTSNYDFIMLLVAISACGAISKFLNCRY